MSMNAGLGSQSREKNSVVNDGFYLSRSFLVPSRNFDSDKSQVEKLVSAHTVQERP